MNPFPVYEILDVSDDEDAIQLKEEEMTYRDEDEFTITTEEEEFASQTENDMTQEDEEISQDEEEEPLSCIETRVDQTKSQFVDKTLKKTEAKIINWRRRLAEKRQILQLKRNLRFEDVNVLHRKLLSTWNDKMNCQHEYGTLCMRSIETSQAAWHAKANFNQAKHSFRPSSHGPAVSNEEERYAREKENIQKQKVEQLARDLIAATEKRTKTLEEVIILLSRELEEAKADIQTLDKELLEIATHLEEMEDLMQTINEGDEESNRAVGTFISCRKLHEGDANLKSSRKSLEKERHSCNKEKEYTIKERSSIIYPSPLRNEGLALRKSIAGPSSTNTGHRTYQSASCRGSFPASARIRDVHFSSFKTSGDKTTDENPNESISSKYEYLYIYESNSKPSSVLPSTSNPASLPSGPRKRGRPRIHPEIVRMPKDNTVKRKRGRPRKYLKLELAKTSSAV